MPDHPYVTTDFKRVYKVDEFARLQTKVRSGKPWSPEDARQCARGDKDPNGVLRHPMPPGWVSFKDDPSSKQSRVWFAKLSDLITPQDLFSDLDAEPSAVCPVAALDFNDKRQDYEVHRLFKVLRELKIPLPVEHQNDFVQRMRGLLAIAVETASDEEISAVLAARWRDGISLQRPEDLKSLEDRTPRRIMSTLFDASWMFDQIREYYRAAIESGQETELFINFSATGQVRINNRSADAGVIEHAHMLGGIGPSMKELVYWIWESLYRAQELAERVTANGLPQKEVDQMKTDLLSMHFNEPVFTSGHPNPSYKHAYRNELRKRCLYCLEPLRKTKDNKFNCAKPESGAAGERKHGGDMRAWIKKMLIAENDAIKKNLAEAQPLNEDVLRNCLRAKALDRRWNAVRENLKRPVLP